MEIQVTPFDITAQEVTDVRINVGHQEKATTVAKVLKCVKKPQRSIEAL